MFLLKGSLEFKNFKEWRSEDIKNIQSEFPRKRMHHPHTSPPITQGRVSELI